MLNAMYAQVRRTLSLPGACAVICLAVVVAGVMRALAGLKFGVGDSAALNIIAPTTGLVLAVYVFAGLGVLVATMGYKTSEDLYLFLSTGSLKRFIGTQVGTSIFLVLASCVPVLGIYIVVEALGPNERGSLIPLSVGLIVSAVTFFWFGHVLTSAFGNPLASLGVILLAPLIFTPQLERLNPQINALLPWSAVHETLYSGIGPNFLMTCSVWIVLFIVAHSLILGRWLR